MWGFFSYGGKGKEETVGKTNTNIIDLKNVPYTPLNCQYGDRNIFQ